jgi:hypothetical protein
MWQEPAVALADFAPELDLALPPELTTQLLLVLGVLEVYQQPALQAQIQYLAQLLLMAAEVQDFILQLLEVLMAVLGEAVALR